MVDLLPACERQILVRWRRPARRGGLKMRVSTALAALLALAPSCRAQPAGVTTSPRKFWNLTATTITQLSVAPAGTQKWSANLCLADPDHAVDPDERLTMTGIAGGLYDVQLADKDGRHCLLRGVALKSNGPYAFSVSEAQMKDCNVR